MLSQAQLLIDLTTNYDASFVINGVTIPDDQLQKRPELNQVIFNPGPGKVVEKFPAGRNCVEADIFRIDGVEEDVPPPAGASTSPNHTRIIALRALLVGRPVASPRRLRPTP